MSLQTGREESGPGAAQLMEIPSKSARGTPDLTWHEAAINRRQMEMITELHRLARRIDLESPSRPAESAAG